MSDYKICEISQELSELNITNKIYSVLSIDIGVNNLGLSCSFIDEKFQLKEIYWIELIDITKYTHTKVQRSECKLHHTKTFSDWMEHLFQEYSDFFIKSDFILVERQPPTGFTVVEQLIFNKWRNKTFLINPINMHMFLRIRDLDYEQRKQVTENTAVKYLKGNIKDQFNCYDRKHDIGDSICMLLYWLDKKQKEYEKQKITEKFNNLTVNGMNINVWFEQYRYKKA